MNGPYRSQGEYQTAILELARVRLTMEAGAQKWEVCTRMEQELEKRSEATVDAGKAAPLEYLFRVFGLKKFERHCVMLALAVELDNDLRDACIRAQGDSALPTLYLCLKTYTEDLPQQITLIGQWWERKPVLSYFFSSGWKGNATDSNLQQELKLDPRIVQFIADYTSEDPVVSASGGILWPETKPLAIRQALLDQMEEFSKTHSERLLFFLYGEPGSGRKTLMHRFCGTENRVLVWASCTELQKRTGSWKERLRPFLREAAIRDGILALLDAEWFLTQEEDWLGDFLREAQSVTDRVFLISTKALREAWENWESVSVRLSAPDTTERLTLWETAMKEHPLSPEVSLEHLASKFVLLPGQIQGAAQKAEFLRSWKGETQITDSILHEACRSQLPTSMGKLSTRIETFYRWEDLILPEAQKEKLREACNQVEFRRKVYEEWGFGDKLAYGRGVSMLFSGPPGTGKTMAAQVIAHKLQLELYKVDLSGIISKYVGETEKQLGAIFDEVRKSQSILFFDEADALFGKRSEVKDAHDRYANIQTAYLLQKIEEYDGIVILASNLQQNFDEAFKRRIRFLVEFTLPDRERREQIWKSVIPAGVPLHEDVDFDFLARSYAISGSSIKNIAVASAFLAAAEQSPVRMSHFLRAVQSEQQKAGKTMGPEDFGEYAAQL